MEKQEGNGNGTKTAIVPPNHAANAVSALLTNSNAMVSAEEVGDITASMDGAIGQTLTETYTWTVEDRKALAAKCVSKVLVRSLTERAIKAGLIDPPVAKRK